MLLYQGDGYLWPHCCMIIYTSNIDHFTPQHTASMVISLFRVTSWFDTVSNIVTCWVNFRGDHLHEHDQQLHVSDYT